MKNNDEKITHEEYAKIVREIERLEAYLEQLKKKTRAYVYEWEAERIENRKRG